MGVVEAIRRIAPTNIQKCRGCIIIRPQLLLTDGAKVNGAILTLTEFKTLSELRTICKGELNSNVLVFDSRTIEQ